MNIDSIRNGIVIDHIAAGTGMRLYHLLKLDKLDCPVAIIKNAVSRRLGKKDIIKIDADVSINFDVIGYANPGATVNIIKDGKLEQKRTIEKPEMLEDVLFCKNPRCISSCEQELKNIFRRTGETYRCIYCETAFKE